MFASLVGAWILRSRQVKDRGSDPGPGPIVLRRGGCNDASIIFGNSSSMLSGPRLLELPVPIAQAKSRVFALREDAMGLPFGETNVVVCPGHLPMIEGIGEEPREVVAQAGSYIPSEIARPNRFSINC